MQKLASPSPEYDTIMVLYSMGEMLGPQLIADIGDVSRFNSKKSLIAFADIDSPAEQSGQMDNKSKYIANRESVSLQKLSSL